MTHIAGARIQAYLDGELSPADVTGIARHLETCARCAGIGARLRARAEVFTHAVGTVDAAEPSSWHTRNAGAHVVHSTLSRALRRAAVVLLAVSGAAAAAIGGRELVARRAGTAAPGGAATPAAVTPPAAGIFMTLRTDSADVVIENAGPGARVRVRASQRIDLAVRVEGGAGAPGFRVDEAAGRVHVSLDGAATVIVDVPATLRSGVVRAGGRVVVRITDGRIEPPDAADAGVSLDS